MLDATTRILMLKYDPTNPLLEWVNQPQSAHVEKQADPVNVVKSEDGKMRIVVVMSSALYTDKQITKACDEFNSVYPEYMSYSYQLPATMFGIPADSWVLVVPEGEAE
ncbi:hypothetical protein [Pseudomonas sp. Pseusp16]|uniref:hypothetical protein n=1 Tax=Pseudomonas sp. Pseusp16 TaxID=3243021 RepID=UPI0039B44C4A